ncbi:MAG: hypothetical protein MK207_12000 [Saprospiraceae bacterium]|nr:hypothetical protein [Saprospiraceae bacterium]
MKNLVLISLIIIFTQSSCSSVRHTKRKGCNGQGWYGNRNLSKIDKLKLEKHNKYFWSSECIQEEEI